MKYRLVLFDFDGTLADSFPFFASVVNDLAERFRFRRIEEHEHERLRHFSAAQMIHHVGLPLWKVPIVGSHFQMLMTQNIHRIKLFDGIDRVLRRLSNHGAVLAVVSSNSCANVQHVLGPENAALVKDFACGVSVFGKQAKFKRILRHTGISRTETIYIADELRDIDAARRAHIAFGAVSWGYTNVEALRARQPEEVFEMVDEIVDKVVGSGHAGGESPGAVAREDEGQVRKGAG